MIIVAGISPSFDLTYQVERLALGQISRSSAVVRCAGGKSLNLARAASTLGGSVRVVAILGGPTGDLLAEMLAHAGIEVTVVQTPHETRTCVSIAAAEAGQLTEVYENTAPVPGLVWQAFCERLTDALHNPAGWLVVSGGAPTGLDPGALADLVGAAQHRGWRVAVDTYGPALAATLAQRPELVKVNRAEAAGLLGSGPEADLAAMAAELQQQTGGVVVLTDGVRGVALADPGDRWLAELPGVTGRFAVGSGDTFLGGLLAELDSGSDYEAALRTAVAASVANACTAGPANFPYAEVARLRPLVRMRAAGA